MTIHEEEEERKKVDKTMNRSKIHYYYLSIESDALKIEPYFDKHDMTSLNLLTSAYFQKTFIYLIREW